MPTLEYKHDLMSKVYLVDDDEQRVYRVTGITYSGGPMLYTVSHAGEELDVYEYELSGRKNRMKGLGLDKEEDDD